MFLTQEEELILKGECGPAAALAMKLLMAIGQIYDAERMVVIKSAQISGVSYKNIGDAGLEFLENFANLGARVCVRTNLNPAGMDLDNWKDLGVSQSFAQKQFRIINAFRKMNIQSSCSCTPYLIGNKPGFGEHIAWAESSAIAYANSVLGARTNREGGPSALASAIIGKTPLYGYHLDENREPTCIVRVETPVQGTFEYSILGYVIGKKLGYGVPLIIGIHKKPKLEELKAFSASVATAGSIALFHIPKITPEYQVASEKREISKETFFVEKGDFKEVIDTLSQVDAFDLVVIGCPHCNLSEISKLAKMVIGKKLKRPVWVYTSREVYAAAERRGLVTIIEKSGGRVIKDTCMVVSPLEELGIKTVATNSCKAAHYLPTTCNVKIYLGSLETCVKAALKQ
ncbi:aconitase X catalytic domain-containing protein [Candidatus Bathyarchaeota archaeon]|nr:aconitase X catalytic domain-containing protein [Candidatus Bathyarchaeota archaeon]